MLQKVEIFTYKNVELRKDMYVHLEHIISDSVTSSHIREVESYIINKILIEKSKKKDNQKHTAL